MKGFLIKQIYEHQYITDNKIAQYIKETESLHKYFTSDFKGIKATSFCGVIKTNNISLLILPKISKDKNYKIPTIIGISGMALEEDIEIVA